ncbi:MAG: aldose 1-epimerase family protein [Nocardioides sp.]|nr:aldose 1-epimerase family protein [Nocardioidaceae bacterium]MCB8956323.1 aldose 1-epimerase family protein [Nocardioides sp.]
MREPSGHTLLLRHGGYAAEVVGVGAALRSLTRDGRDLLAGWPAGEICPDYRGWVLQPWPNRVGDGRYDFAGATHQLPLTEPERGNALHGLAGWTHWDVHHPDASRAVLRHQLVPRAGYPFALDLAVDYHLRDHGLDVTVAATNVGDRPAPYGSGHHPYFTLDRPIEGLELTLPASTWCAMDERQLPGPEQPVEGTPYDFREPRPIGDLVLDHPFGGLTGDTATLRDPATGREATLRLGEGCQWLHVYTCDTVDPRRQAVAIEPTSCPPDAFRTGTDLVVLEPGETHRLAFTITGS